MEFEELLEMLEIDEAGEFQYFENMADLLECEDEISYEAMYKLFCICDRKTLQELIAGYFDELNQGIPADCTGTLEFLKDRKEYLCSLISDSAEVGYEMSEELYDDNEILVLTEEIDKFRKWYLRDSIVECVDKLTGKVIEKTFFEAMLMYRTEKLGKGEYSYGFEECEKNI